MKLEIFTAGLACHHIAAVLFLFSGVNTQDVRLPPDLISGPEKLIIFTPTEKNVQLSCSYRGVPEPGIEWKKDNQTLDLNSANIEVVDGGKTIKLKSAGPADEGKYQCFVGSQNGKAMSDVSRLQMATLAVFLDTDTRSYEKSEGESFILGCIGAPVSVPDAVYFWESVTDSKDEYPKDIVTTKRIQIDDKGNLMFAYLLKSDELQDKLYKCNIRNRFLDTVKGGSYSKLIINQAGAAIPDFAPKIMFNSPTTVVGLVSNNVTLRCFFSAKPEADISWSRDIGSMPDGRWEQKNFNSELLLKNLVASDAGNYVCQGKNSLGISKQTIQLVIESAPVFDSMEDRVHNKNVTVGNTVTMRCAASSIPPPTVTWFSNTEPINPNALPKNYRLSADMKNLTIVDVCKVCEPSSLTVIQCRASNKHDSVFSQGYINVLVAMKITDVSKSSLYEPGVEVTFPCSAVSDDSSPIFFRWYFKKAGQQEESQIFYDSAVFFDEVEFMLHIRTANDSDSGLGRVGDYRCEASNGVSTASITHFFINPEQIVTAALNPLFIVIPIILLLLILLLILLLFCFKQNKGDSYLVDEKERKNGNDPEQELLKDGFHDYQRPTGVHINADQGSITESTGNAYTEDDSSLNAYAMSDPGKFKEDGSFIGEYNTTRSGRIVQ